MTNKELRYAFGMGAQGLYFDTPYCELTTAYKKGVSYREEADDRAWELYPKEVEVTVVEVSGWLEGAFPEMEGDERWVWSRLWVKWCKYWSEDLETLWEKGEWFLQEAEAVFVSVGVGSRVDYDRVAKVVRGMVSDGE